MRPYPALLAALIFTATLQPGTQPTAKEHPIPRLTEKDGRYALFVDGAPYLVLAAQVNNSSAWPAVLPKVWPAYADLHANTVEMPVYWEQFEPKEGQFDYTLIDTLLAQARAHRMRLVLLWFGSFKNANPHYMPEWMKLQPERYPRLVDKAGIPQDRPSPFATASLEADAKAFSAFLRHLRAADAQRTVLMIQVQNEPGSGSDVRDYSPAAQKLFDAPVPPEVLKAMKVEPAKSEPTWTDVFGPDANVCFHNWSVATYIGKIAAAGKAVYPLPFYVNAAPGTHRCAPVGNPNGNIIPVWKVAAPALDMISPDNYADQGPAYVRVLDMYRRPDNALYIPETGGSPRFFFFALGRGAIGFSPFGLDYTRIRSIPDPARPSDDKLVPWARTGTKEFVAPFIPVYSLFEPMQREIAKLNFEGKLQATAEQAGELSEDLHFGPWDATVSYGVWVRYGKPAGNPTPMGGAFVAQLRDDQFLVSGFHCRIDFRPVAADKHRQFLKVEEGTYESGSFRLIRVLNGDQTDGGLDFGAEPLVMRVTVAPW